MKLKQRSALGQVQHRGAGAQTQHRQAGNGVAPVQHRQQGTGTPPAQHRQAAQRAATPMRPAQVKQRLTLSNSQAPVGHWGLFDICTAADLVSLSFSGVDQFIEWLGFQQTDEYIVKRGFVQWMRPAYSSGSPTEGWLSDPCADANPASYGVCDFTLSDFARLRRAGPVRDLTMNNLRRCVNEPRRRIDGSLITSVDEWDTRVAMEAVLNDFRHMLITGNKTTSGQFDGLQRLIKTGYTNSDSSRCELMDSIVVNWNNNGMAGGSGVTWNSTTIANTWGLISVILQAYRNIKTRIMYSPSLSTQPRRVGDIVLMMPSYLAQCVLDAFTCWSVCPGGQYNEVNLNTYEARVFRDRLNGGMFGAGQITLDGDVIPIMPYDYGTITGGTVKVSSLTRSSTTATATTAQAHGLTTGQSVTISGATGAEFNGTFVVTVTGATTFTYTVAGSPTSPDPSTSIYATIAQSADIYLLTGRIGDTDLIQIEGLNMNAATDLVGYPKFQVLDNGRFLTWVESDNTCVQRSIEMRPRLLAWAPWASARIMGVSCPLAVEGLVMDPNSLSFPVKTFTAV